MTLPQSFRPLSGDLISQFVDQYRMEIEAGCRCFRPLPGDLISQFRFEIQAYKECREMFPSPFRGSYFSIKDFLQELEYYEPVSVPFPGILFLNNLMIVRTTNGISCFRPLSGDLISQCVVRGWKYELAEVSVPFPGILFLNDSKWVFDESTTVWFPSPFRGSYFSMN